MSRSIVGKAVSLATHPRSGEGMRVILRPLLSCTPPASRITLNGGKVPRGLTDVG
jgi:hypothetical protein